MLLIQLGLVIDPRLSVRSKTDRGKTDRGKTDRSKDVLREGPSSGDQLRGIRNDHDTA
ncbi:MAG: hypothetical protein HQ527_04410 [Cyanobacteria bacterium]|nr:hypothetical protein [Cyanobacteria bacterium bin.51]